MASCSAYHASLPPAQSALTQYNLLESDLARASGALTNQAVEQE